MLLSVAAKATALFILSLPSVAGRPVPDEDIVSIWAGKQLTEADWDSEPPGEAPIPAIPGLENLMGPDIPHIEDPSIMLGPGGPAAAALVNGTVNGVTITNTTTTTTEGRKHSKRWWGAWWGMWTQVEAFIDKMNPDTNYMFATEFTLINATPYRWRKGYSHSHQMISWESNWPKYVEPGQTFRVSNAAELMNPRDAGGEVTYHLEGVSKPMSFMLQRKSPKKSNHFWRQAPPTEVLVHLLENLKTRYSPRKSIMNVKWLPFPGGCQWGLAGTEGDFLSDDAGPAWMSERLDQIGDIPLRELAMPRSHHAGMWKVFNKFGLGTLTNSITQWYDLKFQLNEGGVRILDLRPLLLHGKDGFKAHEAHGAIVGGAWHGVVGAPVKDMVDQINEFNENHPGELIMFDIHPHQALVRNHPDNTVTPMAEGHRAMLYRELRRLKFRFAAPDSGDLTKLPLNHFIANRTSAVLIRAPSSWVKDDTWPGGAEGFITEKTFPVHQVWTDSQEASQLVERMLPELRKSKRARGSTLFFADWVLNQKGIEVAMSKIPVAFLAPLAYKAMFYELWEGLSRSSYPNWIASDGINSSELKHFTMMVNHCFAAGRCGKIVTSRKDRGPEGKGWVFWPQTKWVEGDKRGKGKDKA